MTAEVTIPISIFELSITYDKPFLRIFGDRAQFIANLFDSFTPWNPTVDDIEFTTVGKTSEQGVKFCLPSQGASFFFGPSSCKFRKEDARWVEADDTIRILEAGLKTLGIAFGVTFRSKVSFLSLHLQPRTVSFKDILRPLIVTEIAMLNPAPVETLAIVSRWPGYRITIDGSAAIANGIFLLCERHFDAGASYDDIKTKIAEDQVELFKVLGVVEVAE